MPSIGDKKCFISTTLGEIFVINIQFNDNEVLVKKNNSLSEILELNGYVNGCYSIALNYHFVPRIYYSTTFLSEGDVVDIITPMQGG